VLYTDFMDEASYKGNRNVFYACDNQVVWCPKYRHVQRNGKCRSAVRHPSTDEAGRGTVLPTLGSRISCPETEVTDIVDELVLLCDPGGVPLSVIKQYIEQQKYV
jgi:hypothetical protein